MEFSTSSVLTIVIINIHRGNSNSIIIQYIEDIIVPFKLIFMRISSGDPENLIKSLINIDCVSKIKTQKTIFHSTSFFLKIITFVNKNVSLKQFELC